ncbi:MAG: hypothetical protein RLZZ129_2061 [Verrucomicrobiota bacterium]
MANDESDEEDEQDDLLSDPVEVRAEFLECLKAAQDKGTVVKRISKQRLEAMIEIEIREGYGDSESLIKDHFPELLTRAGKAEAEEFDRLRREINRTGEYAPEIKVNSLQAKKVGEFHATAKQIRYLRDLGVRDERVLTGLGKLQASDLIDTAIRLREEKMDAPKVDAPVRQGGSGLFGLVIFVLAIFLTTWLILR